MTSVPPQRAGMASGIMSAQRAIGSTVGFAVLGSVLAAWLNATLEPDLATVLPNAAERAAVAQSDRAKRQSARARRGDRSAAVRSRIRMRRRRRASWPWPMRDFVSGIRVALLVAVALLAAVLAIGWKWFPRAGGMVAGAEREAAKLATTEE